MAKRQCKGKTKKGTKCQAAPLKDSSYCSAHDPSAPAETRFGSPEQAAAAGALGGAAGRRPRVVDVMREKIEADIEKVIKPYFDALEHAVMHATYEGSVIVSDVPDVGARIAAAERLLDRAYGKPRQAVEHSGSVDAPVNVEVTLDETAREAIANALRRRPASR